MEEIIKWITDKGSNLKIINYKLVSTTKVRREAKQKSLQNNSPINILGIAKKCISGQYC